MQQTIQSRLDTIISELAGIESLYHQSVTVEEWAKLATVVTLLVATREKLNHIVLLPIVCDNCGELFYRVVDPQEIEPRYRRSATHDYYLSCRGDEFCKECYSHS